jgi:hypothetical protein
MGRVVHLHSPRIGLMVSYTHPTLISARRCSQVNSTPSGESEYMLSTSNSKDAKLTERVWLACVLAVSRLTRVQE